MKLEPDIKIIDAARVGATTCYGCGATEGVRALSVGHVVPRVTGERAARSGNSISVALCAACGDRLAAVVRSPDALESARERVREVLAGEIDSDYWRETPCSNELVDKFVAAAGAAPIPSCVVSAEARAKVEDLIYRGCYSGILLLEDCDPEQGAEYEGIITDIIAAAAGAPPIPEDAAHFREELARMTIERDALRERLASVEADRWRWRGVEDPCERCGGAGCRMYSSGATWRGGMGTARGERDVCDRCWGTGDRYRTGADLRALRDEEGRRVAEAAVGEIARSCGLAASSDGVSLGTVRGAIPHLIIALDRVADKRGAPAAAFLPDLAISLGNVLRRAIGMPERRS